MWRHSIHTFLESHHPNLPSTLDHVLAFIYIAYGIMALLHDIVPTFEDTWIECLGDLARYRMAIKADVHNDSPKLDLRGLGASKISPKEPKTRTIIV